VTAAIDALTRLAGRPSRSPVSDAANVLLTVLLTVPVPAA
jgi:hypothetical protein